MTDLGWLGLTCAALGFLLFLEWRDHTERQRVQAVDALLHSRVQAEHRKMAVFMGDLLTAEPLKPRVIADPMGVFVRAHCEEEAAEIVSTADEFRPRRAE